MLKISEEYFGNFWGKEYKLENNIILFAQDWNGELYGNGYDANIQKDTNKRYIPIYDKDYEIIGFEED